MKIYSLVMLLGVTFLFGCEIVVSPKCNLTNVVRNEGLNKITISVQTEDGRSEADRYFLHSTLWKVREENCTIKHQPDALFTTVIRTKTSVELLNESLSSSFSEYGYNVSSGSPVIIDVKLLKFLYTRVLKPGQSPFLTEIETELSIQHDTKVILNKIYNKSLYTKSNNSGIIDNPTNSFSACLTDIVKEIVLDREIEIALKKAYGIPVQEEQIIAPKVDEIPLAQDSPKQEKQDSIIFTGTGFAVCENGYVATANHVVENAASLQVKFADSEWLHATVVQKSITNDIAILKVEWDTKNYLKISNKVKQGEKIFTLGFPVPGLLGEEPKYAEGVVSSLTGIVDEASLMQISVPLQPGNSGGPLLNEKAEVVGMATSVARIESFYEATGTLPQNVNWGVKATFISPLLPAECILDPASSETSEMDPVDVARNAVCLIKVEKNKN